jgi:V8-like Glu-specific endopeptidase
VKETDLRAGHSEATVEVRTLIESGASMMMVHLDQLALAPGVELLISDAEKTLVHTYPGADFNNDGEGGIWALGVPGDTVLLVLQVADPDRASDLSTSGFHVDSYLWGYSTFGFEGLCGADDRDDVECYATTHPTELERSRAVARYYWVEGGSGWLCTAWRVGPGDMMFTNEHCLEEQSWMNVSQVWFNWERVECHGATNKPPTVVTGANLITNSEFLDFALFTINNAAAVEQYGYLELDVRAPVLHEEVYMAGHPNGIPKIFALESDMNGSGLCEINAVSHPILGGLETGYYCDSSGGQSGSPVIARSSHKVLALHHAGWNPCSGDQMNAGVRMDRIWTLVADYLPWLFSDGFESGDTTAWSSTVP